MKKIQTVYVPTKVENEKLLPETSYGFITNDNNIFQDKFDEEQIIEQYPQKLGFDLLKPTEAFVFTADELKQLLENYTNKIVQKVETKEKRVSYSCSSGVEYGFVTCVNKKSITSQLEIIKQELGI